MPGFRNLKGQKFGRLTVLERDCLEPKGRVRWICECSCGNYATVASSDLIKNHTQSCGCIHREMMKNKQFKHGLGGTRLYGIWRGMKSRCYNKKRKCYDRYGGRGITVCDEWLNDFESFYNWSLANGYRDDLTIDRIDVNGNYEPSNCRWADIKTQANNTSKNHMITAFGQTMTMKEWARKTGINYYTLNTRLRSGLSPEEALVTKNALAEAGTF